MTEKRIKRQKLGGFGANFLEENLERAILTREILIIFLFFIYPWYEKDYNLNFGLVVVGSIFEHISPQKSLNCNLERSKSRKKRSAKKKVVDKNVNSPEISMNTNKLKAGKSIKKKTSLNNLHTKNISTSEATKLLEKKLS